MKKLFIILSVAGLTTSTALAQASFRSIDIDQNGGVTFAEASAAGLPWTEEQFNKADADKDGMLNADEFAAATQ